MHLDFRYQEPISASVRMKMLRQRLSKVRIRLRTLRKLARLLGWPGAPLGQLEEISGDSRTEKLMAYWTRVLKEWPCDQMGELFLALRFPRKRSLEPLAAFCRDVRIVMHMQHRRDMRRLLSARFGAKLPPGVIMLAALYGRYGVLRPFGVRLRPGQISERDLALAQARANLVYKVYAELWNKILDHRICVPCAYCGEISLNEDAMFCSEACEKRERRHERYREIFYKRRKRRRARQPKSG